MYIYQIGGGRGSLDPSSLDSRIVNVVISDLDYKYMNVCAHSMYVYTCLSFYFT